MSTAEARSQSRLRYRPILVLGQGGMAEVHLAVGRGPSGFNKLVVLKTMRPDLVTDAELRGMFLAEARLSARLNHANVVQVYEVLNATLPCIVMQYLEGQCMSAIQQSGGAAFTTAMQLRVISNVLAGLHYSHELRDYDGTPLNIVHRDISPQNVYVTYDGQVKVLDFGIAKVANAPGQTKTGIIKGKVSYMPREQLLGDDLDRRADVYAVGCMMWQAATGQKLWSGTPERDLMRALIEGKIPSPSEFAEVDPRLEAIVMKALAPEPSDRHETAFELQEAVDHYMAEVCPSCTMREVAGFVSELFSGQREERTRTIHTSLSAPSSIAPAADEGADTSTEGTASPTVVLKSERRRRVWARLWPGLALLVLLAGAGYLGIRVSARPEPAPAASSAPSRLVQVRLSITPREATVTVDNRLIRDNPAVLAVPPDQQEHELRAVLAGYVPLEKTIRYEGDVSLNLALEKEQTAPAPAGSSSSRLSQALPPNTQGRVLRPGSTRTRPASRPSAGEGTANCDPPYHYEKGIKIYNPGCF